MASFYKIVSGNWSWFFLQEPENKDYYTAPGSLMKGAAVVNDDPDVKVFHRDGLFFKWEIPPEGSFLSRYIRNMLPSRSKRELLTLLTMKNNGFPVTEPVGFAYNGSQSVLITGKFDADSVMSFLCDKYEKGETLSKEFLDLWGNFINQYIHSGFYSADFHCGNLLFRPETNEFCLVDVYGVRKVLTRKKQRRQRMFFRHLKDASPFMKRSDLEYILQKSGVVYGEKNFTNYLSYSKNAVMEFLQRRLDNRKKSYTVLRPDNRKWNFPQTEQSVISPAEIEDVWKNDYICQLFGIPGIRLTDLYDNGTVVHEKICGEAEEADRLSMISRLASAGFPPEKFAVVLNQAGIPAVIDRRLMTENQRSSVNS